MKQRFLAQVYYDIVDDKAINEETVIYKKTWYGWITVNEFKFNIFKSNNLK